MCKIKANQKFIWVNGCVFLHIHTSCGNMILAKRQKAKVKQKVPTKDLFVVRIKVLWTPDMRTNYSCRKQLSATKPFFNEKETKVFAWERKRACLDNFGNAFQARISLSQTLTLIGRSYFWESNEALQFWMAVFKQDYLLVQLWSNDMTNHQLVSQQHNDEPTLSKLINCVSPEPG